PIPSDYVWQDQLPIPYRPFKPVYKMNLGIKFISIDDLFLIDNTYLTTIDEKKTLLSDQNHVNRTIFFDKDDPVTILAIKEAYNYIVNVYLPKRFPKYFQILPNENLLFNKITNHKIPLDSLYCLNTDQINQLLFDLSLQIQEDLLWLIKDPDNQNILPEFRDEYVLKAATCLLPSSFDPSEKFLKNLTAIHGPVPKYSLSLKTSMNKFFNNLKLNKIVQRNNWSIQLNSNFNQISKQTSRFDQSRSSSEKELLSAKNLDFSNDVFLRSERQCLIRLPKSNAVLFSIRYYKTSLKQIKDENLGNDLATAIDGIFPEMAAYKNRGRWGQACKDFL
ncbi:heme-dependent oxidative N-demethylase family protein ASCRUDRAFT_24378, partial [Ascoidea rubescens DSM 1968]